MHTLLLCLGPQMLVLLSQEQAHDDKEAVRDCVEQRSVVAGQAVLRGQPLLAWYRLKCHKRAQSSDLKNSELNKWHCFKTPRFGVICFIVQLIQHLKQLLGVQIHNKNLLLQSEVNMSRHLAECPKQNLTNFII